VKEEKLLLMALESKDEKEIINVVKQVINNCLIDNDLALDKLPFFDIDYLFIAMRAKSIGETINLRFVCKNIVDEKECGEKLSVQANISNIVVDNKDMDRNIKVTDKITIRMKYPSYEVMKTINDSESDIDKKIKFIMASIDKVIDGDNVLDVNDYKKSDLQEFIEGLTQEQFTKLETFVENYPSFAILIEKDCPKCGFKHKLRYTDFQDFF
jgi:hypothetical protein